MLKKYINIPSAKHISRFANIRRIIVGVILFPAYWLLGYFVNTPGIQFRKYYTTMAFRVGLNKANVRTIYHLLVMPMDSFRYFEFDFLWQSSKSLPISSFLDVSSPRLFPIMLLDRNENTRAHFLNPDKRDLDATQALTVALNLENRSKYYLNYIEDVPLKAGTLDLITSISVIEHILDDKAAIQKMWSLLKPGGKFLITLPCSRVAYEEYINRDDYKLQDSDRNGYYFFQRYYDENLLNDRLFSVTGEPKRFQIYGEKVPGHYHANEKRKRTEAAYPYWQTPLLMGRDYEFKNSLSALSDIGVIALEFVKS